MLQKSQDNAVEQDSDSDLEMFKVPAPTLGQKEITLLQKVVRATFLTTAKISCIESMFCGLNASKHP